MENDPHESLGELVERLTNLVEPGDLTLSRFAGVKSTLDGWKKTYDARYPREQRMQRSKFLKQWGETAKKFFLDLPQTNWNCYFAVGDFEIRAHELLPLGNTYALFESIVLPPREVYILDFADMNNVPQESSQYDLPDGQNSDQRQLYVGCTERRIAVSFNQFSNSLLDNGIITLLPKGV